jgi:hypothetical protein
MADLKRLGVAGFLTEFGADSNHTTGADDIAWMTSAADRSLQSWAYWQFKFFNDPTTANPDKSEGFYSTDGTLQIDKVGVFLVVLVCAADRPTGNAVVTHVSAAHSRHPVECAV